MKNHFHKGLVLVTGTVILLSLLVTVPAPAQDTVKAKQEKGTVVLKIKTGKDGKTKFIDTTFTVTGPSSKREVEEFLKQYDKSMEDYEKALKEIQVMVDVSEGLDSLYCDSTVNVRIYPGHHGRVPDFKWQDLGDAFDYEFDIPCLPEPPMPPDPDRMLRMYRFDDRRGTLEDLLGPVPLESIRSLKIIEKKGGKRIILDLDNQPLHRHGDRDVIILRGDEERVPPPPGQPAPGKVEKKVIIRSGDDEH